MTRNSEWMNHIVNHLNRMVDNFERAVMNYRPMLGGERFMTDKKKGGRPPTGRVRKLSKSVTVKFSKPSYEALRLRARKANRKLAEYIRESALNGEVVSGHNAETVAIAKNLIGMANNLNQLTKLSHQRGFHETHVYVVDLLRRLKAILGEYRQASYKPKPSSMGRKEDTT